MTTLTQEVKKIVDAKLKQWKLDASKQNAITGGEDGDWSDGTQKVKTLNALSGDVTVSEGTGISLTPTGNDIEIAADVAFIGLSDVPAAYAGAGEKIIAVNAEENALEFIAVPDAANGVPSGGTTGQVLSKTDDTDYNTEWATASSGSSVSIWGGM